MHCKLTAMKKKVLFVIGNLQSGGVSKSMVSLLNAFDREQYDVRLFVTCTENDVFGKYLPTDVKIYTNSDVNDLLSGFHGLRHLLSHFKFLLCLSSLLRMALSTVSKSLMGRWLASCMPVVTKEHFDLIVDYNGQHQLYYMVDKLKGKKKITFFHNDYSKWPYYYKADKKYYAFVDHIYSISDICVQSLKKYFPEYADKISVMENISSPTLIRQQAEEPIDIQLPQDKIVIATLGHLCRRKGWDYAIEAAKILKDNGVKFVWLQIGKIIETDLVEMIRKYGLENMFIFTGIQSNPYPYLRLCDIYVHPSRFEGKSIALDEAKILCKPIVVTNFSTVNDQFEDRVNANICKMTGEDVASKIMELLSDANLKSSYVQYLSTHIHDNSNEVEKLYKYLEP